MKTLYERFMKWARPDARNVAAIYANAAKVTPEELSDMYNFAYSSLKTAEAAELINAIEFEKAWKNTIPGE